MKLIMNSSLKLISLALWRSSVLIVGSNYVDVIEFLSNSTKLSKDGKIMIFDN